MRRAKFSVDLEELHYLIDDEQEKEIFSIEKSVQKPVSNAKLMKIVNKIEKKKESTIWVLKFKV